MCLEEIGARHQPGGSGGNQFGRVQRHVVGEEVRAAGVVGARVANPAEHPEAIGAQLQVQIRIDDRTPGGVLGVWSAISVAATAAVLGRRG